MQDLAKKLELSKTTVSYVLSGKTNCAISEPTRQRVLEYAKKYGYRPNGIARALATGKTNAIAVWIPFDSFYSMRIMRDLEVAINADKFNVIARTFNVNSRADSADMSKDIHSIVDGVIAYNHPEQIESMLKYYESRKTPIVNVGNTEVPGVDMVSLEFYSGAYDAVKHLVNNGCKRIAMLLSEQSMHINDSRYRGYTTVIEENALQPEYIKLGKGHIFTEARIAIKNHIEQSGCPDGLFCYNDDVAIGAYRGIYDTGCRVSEDILVIGNDGNEYGEYLQTPLSTVAIPYQELCSTAWKFLKQRIEDPRLPQQKAVIQCRYEDRESSHFKQS